MAWSCKNKKPKLNKPLFITKPIDNTNKENIKLK